MTVTLERRTRPSAIPPEMLELPESEISQRIKELSSQRNQLEAELARAEATVRETDAEFDRACETTRQLARRESEAIERVSHDRSAKATRELGIVQRELERANEAETACRNRLYDAITAKRKIEETLDGISPELDALPRAIEAKKLDARLHELAPIAVAQHETLCRTLMEIAGLDRQAQALGMAPINPRWMANASYAVQLAREGGFQALHDFATKIRLEPEE